MSACTTFRIAGKNSVSFPCGNPFDCNRVGQRDAAPPAHPPCHPTARCDHLCIPRASRISFVSERVVVAPPVDHCYCGIDHGRLWDAVAAPVARRHGRHQNACAARSTALLDGDCMHGAKCGSTTGQPHAHTGRGAHSEPLPPPAAPFIRDVLTCARFALLALLCVDVNRWKLLRLWIGLRLDSTDAAATANATATRL